MTFDCSGLENLFRKVYGLLIVDLSRVDLISDGLRHQLFYQIRRSKNTVGSSVGRMTGRRVGDSEGCAVGSSVGSLLE